MTNLHDLDEGLLLKVLGYLDLEALSHCGASCRILRQVSNLEWDLRGTAMDSSLTVGKSTADTPRKRLIRWYKGEKYARMDAKRFAILYHAQYESMRMRKGDKETFSEKDWRAEFDWRDYNDAFMEDLEAFEFFVRLSKGAENSPVKDLVWQGFVLLYSNEDGLNKLGITRRGHPMHNPYVLPGTFFFLDLKRVYSEMHWTGMDNLFRFIDQAGFEQDACVDPDLVPIQLLVEGDEILFTVVAVPKDPVQDPRKPLPIISTGLFGSSIINRGAFYGHGDGGTFHLQGKDYKSFAKSDIFYGIATFFSGPKDQTRAMDLVHIEQSFMRGDPTYDRMSRRR